MWRNLWITRGESLVKRLFSTEKGCVKKFCTSFPQAAKKRKKNNRKVEKTQNVFLNVFEKTAVSCKKEAYVVN